MSSLAEHSQRPSLSTVLVALCVTEIVSWGLLYYTFPVLASQISADTGWTPVGVAVAFSVALIISALAGIPVGHVLDRHGPRLVMTAGSILGALALVVIASSSNLLVFVVGWALCGLSMAGVLYPPAFAAITGWFTARRIGALTTLTLVAGLASTVFAPLTAFANDQLGWRGAYFVAAAVLALLTVPTHWFLLRRPWPTPAQIDAKDAQTAHAYASGVVRGVQFRLLVAGLTLVSLAMYAALLALVPLMLERGLTAQAAAWVLGLGGLGQVAGRLIYPTLIHRTSLQTRTAIVFGIVTASTVALAVVPGPSGLLIAASMVAGVGRGIATLLQATAVTDRWGPRAYGRLSGILGLPTLLAAALAPGAGAVLAGLSGSYAAGFAVLAALAAAGTVLMFASARTSAGTG